MAEPSFGKWEPIETAPKDGSEIIIGDQYNVGSGFWHDGSICRRADAGWFWEIDRADLLIAKNALVTHWMPLPPPPASQGEGGEG